MLISHIVACGKNGIIGKDKSIPWKIPGEQYRFKTMTSGKTVIMGRKTYDSITKPLYNRNIIVISHSRGRTEGKAEFKSSINCALKSCPTNDEIIIAGGGEIYKQTVSILDRIYLTIINDYPSGNVYYPDLNHHQFFVSYYKIVDNPLTKYTYYTLERKLRPVTKNLDKYLEKIDIKCHLNIKHYHKIELNMNKFQTIYQNIDDLKRHFKSISNDNHNRDILFQIINFLRYNKIPSGFCYTKVPHISIAYYNEEGNMWKIIGTEYREKPIKNETSFSQKIESLLGVNQDNHIKYIYPAIDELLKYHPK